MRVPNLILTLAKAHPVHVGDERVVGNFHSQLGEGIVVLGWNCNGRLTGTGLEEAGRVRQPPGFVLKMKVFYRNFLLS